MYAEIQKALGDKAAFYLEFASPKIAKSRLHLPGPDFLDRIVASSDRSATDG
jgi:class I fructose-bisphosphate aldolase